MDLISDNKSFSSTLEFKDLKDINILRKLLSYKVISYMQRSVLKLEKLTSEKQKSLDVWNNSQVFYLQEMSLAYAHLFTFDCFDRKLKALEKELDNPTKEVLNNILRIYALTNLCNDVGVLREGDFIDSDSIFVLREYLLELCKESKDDCVAIIDSFNIPDFCLQSVLANKNSEDPFKDYFDRVMKYDNAFGRPDWWKVLYENKA